MMNNKKYFTALLLVLVLALTGCQTELYSNLDEKSANQMLSVLATNGYKADKTYDKKTEYTLLVEQADMAAAVKLLTSLGYPRDEYKSMGQVFEKDGLISSPLEERARYVYAVSQDLSDTLSRVDGVIDAKVHVVLPETDVTGTVLKPPSASVFIKYRSEYNLQPFLHKMKLLVNKSIEGIDYNDISIALFPSAVPQAQNSKQWANILSIKVHPDSKARLLLILGLLAALVLVSVGASALFARQQSKNKGNRGRSSLGVASQQNSQERPTDSQSATATAQA